ncbi:ScbR family autoregulator-binding transcription factor [Streptomyces sp. NPDC057302]|uniref:ScbR family autoregulator-binding transcription factor n=1 Tax=Streptomyces sp. NPDC057302 TaxID=3346094 RepID=UPI00362B7203
MAQQERAIRTRQAILMAASAVFDEVGYEAATISEILKRSGVTKGALYFHFTSKDELAQAVLAAQVGSLPPIPRRELTLQEGLDSALVMAYLLSRGDSLVRGSVRLTVEQGVRDGLDRQVPIQAWLDVNEAVLGKAKADGELLPHIDVAAAARLFASCFTGVQIMSKIMTGHADMLARVSELQQYLMTSVAVPGVLVQLDFRPERGQEVYEEAMKAQEEAEASRARSL